MQRFSKKQYQNRSLIASLSYAALLISVWPYARHTDSLPLQLVCALLPVLPMLYWIWLLAKLIWLSDELEQRTHLIGLGIATAVVAVFSLIGGLLANAKVLALDTTALLLLMVFPVLMLGYTGGRWWAARRYGSNTLCDEVDVPYYRYFLLLAVVLGAIAIWSHFYQTDDFRLGLLSGMSGSFALLGLCMYLRHQRQRRRSGETDA